MARAPLVLPQAPAVDPGGPAIEAVDLTKRYEDATAVDHLTLTIRRGEVFGLLGPNGAGKTTTILMLLGLTEPTSGRARVLGLDPTRDPLLVKSRVGYLPDEVGFYEDMSAPRFSREFGDVAVRADGLRKTFGALVAVQGLDLEIRRGEVFGLLGPNGSGKTTTIRMICGLLEPSDGTAIVAGWDVRTDATR